MDNNNGMEPTSTISRITESIFLRVAKTTLLAALVYFVLYYPLGDPFLECKSCSSSSCQECSTLCCLYWMTKRAACNTIETAKIVLRKTLDILYDCKLRLYILLETLDHDDFCAVCRISTTAASTYLLDAKVAKRSQVDKIIENEITYKLADDLVRSIEKKFNVDLERSLDMVMTKIHLLLQNGTQNTLDRFTELQTSLDDMKVKAPAKVDSCLQQKDNQSTALTEKTLHQMVVCGYALIGQDPVLAINKIHTLKNMIRDEVKPVKMNAQKKGIYELLRVCGHEHDSLKKVVKCVISKSPALKSVMMSVTGNLIDGIVELTKMLAHGAMHEACLIEVLKTAEDEAAEILTEVKTCVHNDELLKLNEDNSLVENLKEGDLNTSKIKDENGIERNDVDLKSKSSVIEDSKNNLNSTDPLHENID